MKNSLILFSISFLCLQSRPVQATSGFEKQEIELFQRYHAIKELYTPSAEYRHFDTRFHWESQTANRPSITLTYHRPRFASLNNQDLSYDARFNLIFFADASALGINSCEAPFRAFKIQNAHLGPIDICAKGSVMHVRAAPSYQLKEQNLSCLEGTATFKSKGGNQQVILNFSKTEAKELMHFLNSLI